MNGCHLRATALGLLTGAAGCAVLVLVGYLLYLRLWGDSPIALGLIIALSSAAGLYAGWIVGMLVFSAIRDTENGGGEAV